MNITGIQGHFEWLPLQEPFVLGNVTNNKIPSVIIKITTDAGITGFGEAVPAWEVTGETPSSINGALQVLVDPFYTGRSLLGQSIGTLEEVMNVAEHFLYTRKTPALLAHNGAAKCGLEGAMLDALGRKERKPVYELLGGVYREIDLPLVLGIEDVDATIAKAVAGMGRGHKVVKLKVGKANVGGSGYERDVEVVRQVCAYAQERGDDILVCADANQGYGDSKTAIAVAQQFPSNLSWLEQPVLAPDLRGLREVRQNCDIPIMADEAVITLEDAERLLEAEAVDYLNLKIMKSGMFGVQHISRLAAHYHVPSQIGSMIEGPLGTAMGAATYLATPTLKHNELVGLGFLQQSARAAILGNLFLRNPIALHETKLLVSQGTGFGLEISATPGGSYVH